MCHRSRHIRGEGEERKKKKYHREQCYIKLLKVTACLMLHPRFWPTQLKVLTAGQEDIRLSGAWISAQGSVLFLLNPINAALRRRKFLHTFGDTIKSSSANLSDGAERRKNT